MASLNQRLQMFDRKRMALLDEVEALEARLLVARPRPDTWSIREIVEHLVLAERDVLKNLPEASQLHARERTAMHHLLYGVVIFVLRFGIPVPVPAPAMLPSGNRPLGELRRMWDENHEWLRMYVADLDREGRRRAVFRHPIAGPLTAGDAVQMLDVHLHTHTRQIRRLERLLQSGSSGERRIAFAVLLLGSSVVLRIARGYLTGVENPMMVAWPGQVIFGFYFAILALAIQTLHAEIADGGQWFPEQMLLLLALIGLCLDLVLVNIQETITHVDASYGFVVLWDATTFFVWLRVVELCRPGLRPTFLSSTAVTLAPCSSSVGILFFLFSALGACISGPGMVICCLFVGVLPLVAFQAIPQHSPHRSRVALTASMVVLSGAVIGF